MVRQGDYENYMREALRLGAEAAERGEIPVGCVIADGAGRVIGAGSNRREETRCVTGHAELEALEKACRARGDWRMEDCTLFVTLEPCPMCAGAMIGARLGALVYGARERETGAAGSVLNLFMERFGHQRTAVYSGVLEAESAALLRAFFDEKRKESPPGGLGGHTGGTGPRP